MPAVTVLRYYSKSREKAQGRWNPKSGGRPPRPCGVGRSLPAPMRLRRRIGVLPPDLGITRVPHAKPIWYTISMKTYRLRRSARIALTVIVVVITVIFLLCPIVVCVAVPSLDWQSVAISMFCFLLWCGLMLPLLNANQQVTLMDDSISVQSLFGTKQMAAAAIVGYRRTRNGPVRIFHRDPRQPVLAFNSKLEHVDELIAWLTTHGVDLDAQDRLDPFFRTWSFRAAMITRCSALLPFVNLVWLLVSRYVPATPATLFWIMAASWLSFLVLSWIARIWLPPRFFDVSTGYIGVGGLGIFASIAPFLPFLVQFWPHPLHDVALYALCCVPVLTLLFVPPLLTHTWTTWFIVPVALVCLYPAAACLVLYLNTFQPHQIEPSRPFIVTAMQREHSASNLFPIIFMTMKDRDDSMVMRKKVPVASCRDIRTGDLVRLETFTGLLGIECSRLVRLTGTNHFTTTRSP